ncbi:Glycosyltransferase, GT2 family [Flavobacterium flevense]|uniref:Glycosyl transferase family 2 n=1 Tax=Flavobacterium flevense TaxID=983 RepID=A0A4Y4B1K0_9FLAO|nr:glycosyltransferase [Flavobacterium flevense]GEC73459.1 glycosyl transferase family 2 [Flavobacterium flevense]SHM00211.1 Glycosyltransferase, GT2 family [Flavobacterium flevense]
MRFSLIICTYMRPESLLRLLQSVQEQTLYPNEILIVDGSINNDTTLVLEQNRFQNLYYFLVSKENRGLTKQRNFGITKVADSSEIVCFLDDDTVLETDYFEEIIKTFKIKNEAIGVGGIAINGYKWKLQNPTVLYNKNRYYCFENHVYKEGLRNVVRNYLGLASNLPSGRMPDFSHGRTSGFPMTGKTYEVDLLIGMSMAFRKSVFKNIQFSKFFEGYGLYEDADFSLRALSFGKNYCNTNAQLSHFHAASGRPNQYQYGKMVVRNGWYVWRVKNPNPVLKDKIKWYAITLLLTIIRFSNIFTGIDKMKAFTEALGRTIGVMSLFFSKPKVKE